MLGYPLPQLLGKHLWEIGFFRDRKLSEAAFVTLQNDGYIRYEDLPLESKDGRKREVEFVSNMYRVGEEMVVQCNIRDITDRRRLEAQVLQAQKMEAVGQLAGGVAHDYNNILTSTLLQLSLLLCESGHAESTRNTLRQLLREAERAAGLTRQLLLFSRKQAMSVRLVDLNRVLTDLFDMLRRLLSEDVQLEYVACAQPLWAEADAGMIEQVITNLCLNAQDAMEPNGGRLLIETKLVESETTAMGSNPEAMPGSFACISVADTGSGMDPATLEHIFEPFFTTKAVGKGTGLGLSTVYGVAKQHGGWVEVSSQVGKGSVFRVFIPARTKTGPAGAEGPSPETARGQETVLLVDDEKVVRDMVALGLQHAGYRVYQAGSGADAVKVWLDHSGEIDLLFSDMRMPGGISGMDLFTRFKGEKATLRGIISSGYSSGDFVKSRELVAPGLAFLPKPYDVRTLTAAVRKILDQGRHPCPPVSSN
jgi:signal transduction histidine kinase/ActR/RegA family two-component response regulator